MKIGIVGAGHAGLCMQALANNSTDINAKIHVCDNHRARIDSFLQFGGKGKLLDRTSNGGEKNIEIFDTDLVPSITELVKQSDIIYNTTPIGAHEPIFSEVSAAAQGLKKEIVYISLGGGFSIFSHMIEVAGNPYVGLGTLHTLPFACRADGNTIELLNVRKSTLYSFAPFHKDISSTLEPLEKLFGAGMDKDDNILHMSLDRSSYVMHPTITLFNSNKIERGEKFYFYRDGFTKSINQILIAAGEERQRLAHHLGFDDYPDPQARLENFHRVYMRDFVNVTPPPTLDHRYLHEDIPFGLVPICTLGTELGVDMATCRALVDISSVMVGSNFWKSPFNLQTNPELKKCMLEQYC